MRTRRLAAHFWEIIIPELTMTSSVIRLVIATLAALVPSAFAQCGPQWLPGFNFPGVDVSGTVSAACTWDPDGGGPQAPKLVLGGSFTRSGGVATNSVCSYDPQTGAWSPFGSGMNGSVLAVAALPNGALYAGGTFSMTGSTVVNRIARWDGAAWQPLGSGLTGPNPSVFALLPLPNGEVIVGGYFDNAGGSPANSIARWNGSTWTALGSGFNGGVFALALMPNGDIIAGGEFTFSGAPVARWTGAVWTSLGSAFGGSVRSLAVLGNDDIIVGGSFSISTPAGPANYIARWSGSAWSRLGSGISNGPSAARVDALATVPDGSVAAAGFFSTAGGVSASNIARWNGSTWSPLAAGMNSSVSTLTMMPSGDLLVGGAFWYAGDVQAYHVARWAGGTWCALGAGMDNWVHSLATLSNGDVVAGGHFSRTGGIAAEAIASWNGWKWSPLGQGLSNGQFATYVRGIDECPNGDIIAVGDFTVSGTTTVNHVARWDGAAWQPLGSGVTCSGCTLVAVAALPNGNVIVGGNFDSIGGVAASNIAHWNGSAWSALGAGVNGQVRALIATPGGNVIAGGSFSTAGGLPANHIARWNGAWSPVGLGTESFNFTVCSLTLADNGDVIAGTDAAPPTGNINVARWNGSVWSAVGGDINGQVLALRTLANGDIIAGGLFSTAGGLPASSIARWNGTTWSALGSGTTRVYALTGLPNNDVLAGGDFIAAGGVPSSCIGHYTFSGPTPVITQQPQPATACPSGAAAFSVTAKGSELTYQWQIQSGPNTWLNLAASPTALSCGGSAAADHATSAQTSISITPCPGVAPYQVRCLVSTPCGNTASDLRLTPSATPTATAPRLPPC